MWDGGGAVCCAHPFYFPNLLLLCVLVHRELFHDHSERYPFSVSSFVIVSWFIGNYFTITARGILFQFHHLWLWMVWLCLAFGMCRCRWSSFLAWLQWHLQNCCFCSLLCVCGHSWMHRLMGRLILSVTVWLWSMYVRMICRWKGLGLESEN